MIHTIEKEKNFDQWVSTWGKAMQIKDIMV